MADHEGPAANNPGEQGPDTAPAWAAPNQGPGAPQAPYGGNPQYPGAPYQQNPQQGYPAPGQQGYGPQQGYPGQQPQGGVPFPGAPGPGSGPYTPPPFPGQPGPGQQPGAGPYGPQPPFQQPGQPGFGGGYQAPPKKGNGLLIGLLAGGGVLLVLIVVVVLLASGVFSGSSESASKRLQDAGKTLSTAKGVKYNGQLSSLDATLSGGFEVTSQGRAAFNGSWSSSQVQVLSLDDKVFAKGDSSFWKDQGDFDPSGDYADNTKWGRMSSYKMNFDFKQYLSPASIAKTIADISSYDIKSTVKTTAGGVSAQKITTYNGSFYVSASGTPKLLRVERTGYPSYALDVDVAGGATAASDIKAKVGELKDSFDGSSEPSATVTGADNCRHSATACTTTAHVFAARTGATGSVGVSVHVWLTSGTSTGPKIDSCDTTGTISSSSVDLTCTMSSSGWKNWAGSGSGTKWFYYHATAEVGGASDSDISAMQTALDSD